MPAKAPHEGGGLSESNTLRVDDYVLVRAQDVGSSIGSLSMGLSWRNFLHEPYSDRESHELPVSGLLVRPSVILAPIFGERGPRQPDAGDIRFRLGQFALPIALAGFEDRASLAVRLTQRVYAREPGYGRSRSSFASLVFRYLSARSPERRDSSVMSRGLIHGRLSYTPPKEVELDGLIAHIRALAEKAESKPSKAISFRGRSRTPIGFLWLTDAKGKVRYSKSHQSDSFRYTDVAIPMTDFEILDDDRLAAFRQQARSEGCTADELLAFISQYIQPRRVMGGDNLNNLTSLVSASGGQHWPRPLQTAPARVAYVLQSYLRLDDASRPAALSRYAAYTGRLKCGSTMIDLRFRPAGNVDEFVHRAAAKLRVKLKTGSDAQNNRHQSTG